MKILVVRKKLWVSVGCLLLALVIVSAVSLPASVTAAATKRELPIYSVQPQEGEKKLSISFDAAWGADDTDTLIEILGKYNVKATFFVVAQWVDTYPDEVRKLADAGHEVLNHSTTHPYFTQCSEEKVRQEVETCNDRIEAITGVRPTLIRCPYGDYNDSVIRTIRSLGMEPIQWSVDSLDWMDSSTADSIFRKVTGEAQAGSIILCHNDAKYTPDALEDILKTLLDEGYTFVPISQLILTGDYTIDHTGMQCPA